MSASAWLPVFRLIADEVRSRVVPLVGTARGRAGAGVGAGGDGTVYLDALAEEIAVQHLETAYRSGLRFQLLSEELGAKDFGASAPIILLDPIDGSLNAKHGLPYCAITLAVAARPVLGEVVLGFVKNLISGDEFYAERGGGAFLNGRPIEPVFPPDGYGLVQLDAPKPLEALNRVRQLLAHAERLRILGSAALNLCHTATGGIGLQVAPLPVRAFDLAGPLLVLKEAGGVATALEGDSLDQVTASLETRTTLLASASPALHARALDAVRARSD